MLREFVQLVSEAVNDGYDRGVQLFMENLEYDLAKSEIINENGGLDATVAHMLITDGYDVDIAKTIDIQNLDESKIDAMYEHMKKEGLV